MAQINNYEPPCEDETAYLMDRKDVEKWTLGGDL